MLGSPHKARKAEEQTEGEAEVLKSPLLQFDLKFDFLKDYLENVTTVINQHASMLNKLKTDVGAKVYEKNVMIYIYAKKANLLQ